MNAKMIHNVNKNIDTQYTQKIDTLTLYDIII